MSRMKTGKEQRVYRTEGIIVSLLQTGEKPVYFASNTGCLQAARLSSIICSWAVDGAM